MLLDAPRLAGIRRGGGVRAGCQRRAADDQALHEPISNIAWVECRSAGPGRSARWRRGIQVRRRAQRDLCPLRVGRCAGGSVGTSFGRSTERRYTGPIRLMLRAEDALSPIRAQLCDAESNFSRSLLPIPERAGRGRSCVIGSPVFPETGFRAKICTAPILENGDRSALFPGRSSRT